MLLIMAWLPSGIQQSLVVQMFLPYGQLQACGPPFLAGTAFFKGSVIKPSFPLAGRPTPHWPGPAAPHCGSGR